MILCTELESTFTKGSPNNLVTALTHEIKWHHLKQ